MFNRKYFLGTQPRQYGGSSAYRGVKAAHLCQALQREVGDDPDLAVVEEHLRDAAAADEARVDELGHVVAVEVDGGGVHGDEGRHVLVPAVRTLDDIVAPVVVVVARAALPWITLLKINIFAKI